MRFLIRNGSLNLKAGELPKLQLEFTVVPEDFDGQLKKANISSSNFMKLLSKSNITLKINENDFIIYTEEEDLNECNLYNIYMSELVKNHPRFKDLI